MYASYFTLHSQILFINFLEASADLLRIQELQISLLCLPLVQNASEIFQFALNHHQLRLTMDNLHTLSHGMRPY